MLLATICLQCGGPHPERVDMAEPYHARCASSECGHSQAALKGLPFCCFCGEDVQLLKPWSPDVPIGASSPCPECVSRNANPATWIEQGWCHWECDNCGCAGVNAPDNKFTRAAREKFGESTSLIVLRLCPFCMIGSAELSGNV